MNYPIGTLSDHYLLMKFGQGYYGGRDILIEMTIINQIILTINMSISVKYVDSL